MDERRIFSRILFNSKAHLLQGKTNHPINLLDLSFKGALITKPQQWQNSDELMLLKFTLSNDEVELTMKVKTCHDKGPNLGLELINIDIDSASHLKRLIELNLGDELILQRELSELSAEN